MDSFFNLVKALPEDQRRIFYKYMGVVSACELDVEEKIAFVKENGIFFDKEGNVKIKTARALVRVFAMDIRDLKSKYAMFMAAGKELNKEEEITHLVTTFPEILRYDRTKVLARIVACDKLNDKPIMIGDRPAGYIIDDVEWNNLIRDEKLKKARDDGDIKPFIEEHMKGDFASDESDIEAKEVDPTSWLEEEQYDLKDVNAFARYQSLLEVSGNTRSTLGSTAIGVTIDLQIPNELMKELGKNPDRSDKDIIKACLNNCGLDTDGIDDVIDNFLQDYTIEEEEKKRGR